MGGGAGGVELSLALNHRLEVERAAAGHAADSRCLVKLLSSGEILQGHIPAARRKFLRIMQVIRCIMRGYASRQADWLHACIAQGNVALSRFAQRVHLLVPCTSAAVPLLTLKRP